MKVFKAHRLGFGSGLPELKVLGFITKSSSPSLRIAAIQSWGSGLEDLLGFRVSFLA